MLINLVCRWSFCCYWCCCPGMARIVPQIVRRAKQITSGVGLHFTWTSWVTRAVIGTTVHQRAKQAKESGAWLHALKMERTIGNIIQYAIPEKNVLKCKLYITRWCYTNAGESEWGYCAPPSKVLIWKTTGWVITCGKTLKTKLSCSFVFLNAEGCR